jgi:ankyrin repeat protein
MMRDQLLIAAMIAVMLAAPFSATAADSELIQAVQANNRAAALRLIDQRADVNAASGDGTTALHWAVFHGDIELVDRLIKAGANLDARNEFGASPLSEAVGGGNVVILERLLKAGADPNVVTSDGQTALMTVARSTNLAAAKLLLDHGANVNATETQKQQTALMWAAAQKHPEMVKLLVSRGASVDARATINVTATAMWSDSTFMDWPSNVSAEPRAGPRAPGGMTALLLAAREGCAACAQALIDGGADVDMPEPEGITPLIMAITNMHFDTAKVLIQAGANPNKWDMWGRTPLYAAADVNTLPHGGRADRPSLDDTSCLEIIGMLLDAGGNPNIQLKLLPPYRNVGADRGVDRMLTIGASALLRAAKALDAPAIELMLRKGGNPNLPQNRGISPILAAAGVGSVDADTRGWFITEDVEQRAIDSLDLLLKAGGNIQARDDSGMTPLHGAAFWGWNDVVKFLVSKGADVNAKENRGYTPYDSALGRTGGNSRGGARIDVWEDTAALLKEFGGVPGTPAAQPRAPR